MAAPTVHLLSSATFNDVAIADVISASIDESGSPQEYVSADSPNVKLAAVDRIAATVVVTKQGYSSTPAIGDAAASDVGLKLIIKPRAEGKGVTTPSIEIDFTKAVVYAKSSGPTIEGTPTYSITFRCYAAP